MINKILKSYPYLVILISVLYLFSQFLFQNIDRGSYVDFKVYINVVQSLTSGGVLYQSAIDTKNMGFFLIFFLIYKLYTYFFLDLAYFYIFQATFLSILYFGIGGLIYKIISIVWNKYYGLSISCLSLIFLSTMEYTYFINQSQTALFFHLLLIYILIKTVNTQTFLHFLYYGILLGICFSIASPYVFLTLIIPIIAIQKYVRDKSIRLLIGRCLISFLGFLLSLLPFFLYFYSHNALSDWGYWNFSFVAYTYTNDLSLLNRFLLTLQTMVGPTRQYTSWLLDTREAFAHFSIINFIYLLWLILSVVIIFTKKYLKLSPIKNVLLVSCSIVLLSRFTLVRGYLSYNLYIIPVLFVMLPFILEYFKNFYKNLIIVILLSWGMSFIGRFNNTFVIKRHFNTVKYSQELKNLTLNNPTKTPTVITGGWGKVLYSTKWKLLYYNVYDTNSNIDLQSIIMAQQPELLIDINHTTPILKDFIDKNYQAINIWNIYIRKDKIASWILP